MKTKGRRSYQTIPTYQIWQARNLNWSEKKKLYPPTLWTAFHVYHHNMAQVCLCTLELNAQLQRDEQVFRLDAVIISGEDKSWQLVTTSIKSLFFIFNDARKALRNIPINFYFYEQK